MDQRKKLGYMWVHPRHFGKLSPGVRPFPQNPPIFQNRRFFQDLYILEGSYVPRGDRQGKNKFPPATPPRYCLSKNKGALIHSLPAEKQKKAPKYRPGWGSKITTLICVKSIISNQSSIFINLIINRISSSFISVA